MIFADGQEASNFKALKELTRILLNAVLPVQALSQNSAKQENLTVYADNTSTRKWIPYKF